MHIYVCMYVCIKHDGASQGASLGNPSAGCMTVSVFVSLSVSDSHCAFVHISVVLCVCQYKCEISMSMLVSRNSTEGYFSEKLL